MIILNFHIHRLYGEIAVQTLLVEFIEHGLDLLGVFLFGQLVEEDDGVDLLVVVLLVTLELGDYFLVTLYHLLALFLLEGQKEREERVLVAAWHELRHEFCLVLIQQVLLVDFVLDKTHQYFLIILL